MGHGLEQPARETLLVRLRDLGDEERARREYEVSADDSYDRSRETESPVHRAWADHRK